MDRRSAWKWEALPDDLRKDRPAKAAAPAPKSTPQRDKRSRRSKAKAAPNAAEEPSQEASAAKAATEEHSAQQDKQEEQHDLEFEGRKDDWKEKSEQSGAAVARVAAHLHIAQPYLIIPVPPGRLCLCYNIVASDDYETWMQGRSTQGLTTGTRSGDDEKKAEAILDRVISLMEAGGQAEAATALKLTGGDWCSDPQVLEYFSKVKGGRIEVYSLMQPEEQLPMATYGNGAVKIRLGRQLIHDSDYRCSEHLVGLRWPEYRYSQQNFPPSGGPAATSIRGG